VYVRPVVLERLSTARAAWYETPEEVAAGLEWGRHKRCLLHWIRQQMENQLSDFERECVELYFFETNTYREVADLLDVNVSSAHRAIARGLRKLRAAAAEEGVELDTPLKQGRARHPRFTRRKTARKT